MQQQSVQKISGQKNSVASAALKATSMMAFPYKDNRPEAIAQRRIQDIILKNQKQTPVMQLIKSTDLTDVVKAGSPANYRSGDWFVKRWSANSQTKSNTMRALWDAADAAAVPVPQYKQERLEDVNEYIFASKKCKGDSFFQHSKPGHPTELKAWLSLGHDEHILKRYKAIFAAAKMGDPQGYYENTKNGKIEFMDIQQMTGGGSLSEYVAHIDELLTPVEV
jgi:hypothetical protein